MEILGFQVGELNMALDIREVQEILEKKNLVQVPGSPSYIEGVFNLRGNIIPLIDLRKKLGEKYTEEENECSFLVVQVEGGRTVALKVEKIIGTFDVSEMSEKVIHHALKKGLKKVFFKGTCELGNKRFFLIDIEKFLGDTKEDL